MNDGKKHTIPRFGFAQFRFVIATILLLAAGLKAYQLATAPLPPTAQGSFFTPLLELLSGRYLLMAVVVGELLFALILIVDLCRAWAWLFSLLGFSVFVLISMVKGIAGESDCQCWGTFAVNPYITMSFDLVVVALLVVFRERITWAFPSVDRKKLVAVLIAWLVLVGPVLFAMLSLKQQPHATLGTEFVSVDGRVTVMLEPTMWGGKRFPLWDYVDDESRAMLEKGEWNIVIGRKQCEECKQLVEKLETQTAIPIAVLEIDDGTTDVGYSESQVVKGHLKIEPHWVFLTPYLIQCRDGVCVSVGENPLDNE